MLKKYFKQALHYIKVYVFRGFLTIIPLGLCLLAIQFLFNVVDRKIVNFFDVYVGYRIPGLGILIVLVLLFLIGFIASSIMGRQFLNLIEFLTKRIPFIKQTYEIGKQISQSLSLSDQPTFKKGVLVDYAQNGTWTMGFVTGETILKNGKKLLKIFVPTSPTPFGGFLIWAEESRILDPGWNMDEVMKVVVSCGLIGGEEIK